MKLNNNSNKLVISILIFSVLFISIGYSYLQTTLSINGEVSFDESLAVKKAKILGHDYDFFMDNVASDFVRSTKGIDFAKAPSDTNGKGLYLRAETENDKYPIYYFRGGDDIDGDGIEDYLNNHVLFGGFCWKIVRTTEQGGTKLIYDGEPDANNQCNNTGISSQLSTLPFNLSHNSLADVGYMYGTRYSYTSWFDTLAAGEGIIYASDVTYSGGVYTLLTDATWPDPLRSNPTKHYTCNSTTDVTCDTVYYVYSFYDELAYAIELTNGDKIDDIISKSFANENDSNIKTIIDNWFRYNLISQESKLEDAVWCNDRSIANGGYLADSDLTADRYGATYFGRYESLTKTTVQPAVKDIDSCPNKRDRFTKSDTTVGNGKLTYPVGLLTADEATIAGHGWNGYSKKSYLNTGQYYWLMSPTSAANFGHDYVGFTMSSNGSLGEYITDVSIGVRPSIVLKHDIVATSGKGTATEPYVVE